MKGLGQPFGSSWTLKECLAWLAAPQAFGGSQLLSLPPLLLPPLLLLLQRCSVARPALP